MASTRVLIKDSGMRGPVGPAGPAGAAGSGSGGGVPNGGTTGQALVKTSNADQATGWGTVVGGGSVAGDTHAAALKTPPVDADEFALVDSAASFALKRLTWANLKATMKTYLDSTGIAKLTTARTFDGVSFDGTANVTVVAPATHAATSKTTPVDADEIPLADSAASFALKRLTVANLKTLIGTYMASATQTVTNKDMTSGTNTFPAFTDATKVPTTRTINGFDLSANRSLAPADLAVGTITDAQQIKGAMMFAYFDGTNWVDAAGTILVARPSIRTDVTVVWVDRTSTGAAAVPSFALDNVDLFLQSNGVGAPTSLFQWYGLGLTNGSSITAGTAGTGDMAVTSVGGTTPPTVNTGATITPAVSFAQAAAQVCNLHFNTGSTQTTGRARIWFQTPAAWYASSQTLFKFTDASDVAQVGLTLRGSGTPGVLSVNDTTNANITSSPNNTLAVSTWYRLEEVIDTVAGKARLQVYNTTGTSIYDTGLTTMAVGTGWQRVIWGPAVSAVTTSMLMAKLKVNSDTATPIGAA